MATLGMILTSRTFAEYRAMFALDDEDLTGVCLDCGGGAAGFVAGATAAGARALAVDPLYASGPDALAARLPADLARAYAMVTSNAERFVWHWHGSAARQRELRLVAGAEFAFRVPRRETGPPEREQE